MPQHSTHTHTHTGQPSQTRIEQNMVVPQTQLIPLFWAVTGIVLFSFHSFIECDWWEMFSFLPFLHRWVFRFVGLHLVSQAAILTMFYYLCICAFECAHTYFLWFRHGFWMWQTRLQACRLCGAGCSSTADAQWFTSKPCVCASVSAALLCETLMSSVFWPLRTCVDITFWVMEREF